MPLRLTSSAALPPAIVVHDLDGPDLADACRRAVLSYPPARAALRLSGRGEASPEADALTNLLALAAWRSGQTSDPAPRPLTAGAFPLAYRPAARDPHADRRAHADAMRAARFP